MNENREYKKQMNSEDVERIKAIVNAMVQQRKALGMSQRDLAVVCDMPQSTIARIETFKSTPNLTTVLRMFYYLGLDMTVNQKRAEEIEAELQLWREIEKGEKSGEEKGWLSLEEVKSRFRDRVDGI